MVSSQFTLEIATAAPNREKFTKNPYFGGSRSFRSSMLVPQERSSAVLFVAASLCLSSTVLTLDEIIVVNNDFLGGGGTSL